MKKVMTITIFLIAATMIHADTETVNGITWTYTVTGDTVSIGGGSSSSTAVPTSTSGAITIPSTIDGKLVTAIGSYAFSGCGALTNVTVPNSVTNIEEYAFCHCSGLMNIAIPDSVTTIGEYAFAYCDGITAVVIPNSVKVVCIGAFAYCKKLKMAMVPQCICALPSSSGGISSSYSLPPIKTSAGVSRVFGCDSIFSSGSYGSAATYPCDPALTNIIVAQGTTYIADSAFVECNYLQSVTIPASVTRIGNEAFKDCASLNSLVFEGDAPDVGTSILFGTPRRLEIKVQNGSIGWSDDFSDTLPSAWNGRRIAYASDSGSGGSGSSGGGSSGEGTTASAQVALTVTNVVVHYVLNSIVPEIAVPVSGDTGFVTVVTEITGGAVAVAESWATNYPGFTEKFGSDFSTALTKTSGKRDSQGNALMVWQDYVAGTDPTDENDIFKASITLVDGVPQVSYTPELPEAETAKRKYTTYGKARLQDEEWSVVDGDAANYNFFKVTVEMR